MTDVRQKISEKLKIPFCLVVKTIKAIKPNQLMTFIFTPYSKLMVDFTLFIEQRRALSYVKG